MKTHHWIVLGKFITVVMLSSLLISARAAALGDLNLVKTPFSALTDWDSDDHTAAYAAFLSSCGDILKRKPNQPLSPQSGIDHGTAQSWQRICQQALMQPTPTPAQAKTFFETQFDAYHVGRAGQFDGQFTGYYLPLIHASRDRDERYRTPVHGVPWDLVKISLNSPDPTKAGQFLIRQRKDNQLIPYADRETILSRTDLNTDVLVWADSVVDVFFAHVQGSAVVELPNKERLLLGYAGKNGHAYTSIGKVLIEKNQLTKENVSMQTIRQWLEEHPAQADSLLNTNASYVFFRRLPGENPVGTEQVPLTPGRSLAVDQRVIPLGAPVWLSTSSPVMSSHVKTEPLHRLVVAQDTGGAIKGAVRGDVYWGAGDEASYKAGYMNSPGQYWVLLPSRRA